MKRDNGNALILLLAVVAVIAAVEAVMLITISGRVDELLPDAGATRIVASGLSDATLDRIRDLVRSDGGEIREVGSERGTLEDFFIEKVRGRGED